MTDGPAHQPRVVRSRFIRSGLLLAAFCAGLLAGTITARAEVTGTTTYDVSGKELCDVWADIEANGPQEDGLHLAGEADSRFRGTYTSSPVSCTSRPASGCPGGTEFTCSGSLDAVYTIETTIMLPHWTGYDASCPAAQAEWDRFVGKLAEHEQGHDAEASAALAAATPMTHFVASSTNRDSDVARSDVTADLAAQYAVEAARLRGLVDAAGADYDAATAHGTATGAELDKTIKCPKVVTPTSILQDMIADLDFADNQGVANSLQQKLRAAIDAIASGNTRAAKGKLRAFINEVKAQSGKAFTEDEANGFMADARDVISRL
jgi:predicted secreted Zn-dependent protease